MTSKTPADERNNELAFELFLTKQKLVEARNQVTALKAELESAKKPPEPTRRMAITWQLQDAHKLLRTLCKSKVLCNLGVSSCEVCSLLKKHGIL